MITPTAMSENPRMMVGSTPESPVTGRIGALLVVDVVGEAVGGSVAGGVDTFVGVFVGTGVAVGVGVSQPP